jgi:integrase
MRKRLTPAFILKAPLPEKGDRVVYWDADPRGFGLMVTAAGRRSYVLQYRANGRSRRFTFKPGLSLSAARNEARKLVGDVAKGADPLDQRRSQKSNAENTLRAIAEMYFAREGKKLRTIDERRAGYERLIFPKLGNRPIDGIKRSDIVRLLDHLEDERGPRAAQAALAYLSRLFVWHAGRNDDFRSPIVRGMARIKPGERARERTLSDEKLRALWRAAEAYPGPFGKFLQFALLTATRRNEAARMARAELDGGLWIIPAARMKAKAEHVVPLSTKARDLLAGIPTTGPYVFTIGGQRPIRGWGKFKAAIDKRSGVTGWVLHDLRRTARSLMSRAGVDADVAERCLAHTIRGVRGTYDRHSFLDEKRLAFEKLAAMVDRIVDPQPNVVPMRISEVPG